MWNFNKILEICNIEILKVKSSKKTITFYLKQRRITACCPKCKKRTSNIHGKSPIRKIKHETILSKTCTLFIYPRRFNCLRCNLIFTENILLPPYERTTQKHKREVINALSNQSFSFVSKKYKVSYYTQRRWLEELIQDEIFNFNKEEKEKTSFVLGIDEVSFAE